MDTAQAVAFARLRKMLADGEAERIRRTTGTTLEDVGRVAGVSAYTVGRWERGERTPRTAPALAYLELLDALAPLTVDNQAEATA